MQYLLATLLLALLFIPATSFAQQDRPLTLVDNGQARAAIVVEADQPKSQQAAEALATHIEKMTGAKLPIISEDAPDEVKADVLLLVGHTEAAKKLGIEIPSGYDTTVRPGYGEEEGYVLKTAGNNIIIAGNNDGPYNGTVFAAYALLERLGCRFYMPGQWGQIIPSKKTLTVEPLDITARPDFAVRDIWLSGWVPVSRDERAIYAEWCASVGLGGGNLYPVAGDGFLAMLLPPEEYAESNPEFYAMRTDGTRRLSTHRATGKPYVRHTNLCLSNPQVLEESIKNIRETFEGKRNLRNVSELGVGISPPDGAPFCFCEDCKAASQNFDYPRYVHEKMQSEEYFGFSAKLARAFPDKFIATMAYSNREVPPQGIDPFPQNIAVKHATISCDVLHPNDTHLWRRRDMVRMLREWWRLTPHVVVRDYNPGMLVGMYVPERDMANQAVNIPMYKDIGVKGMHREGRKIFMQTWLSYYITAKLLWDTEADVEAIKKDFYHTMFGPEAGAHVQAWWDNYEAALLDTTVQIHEDWLMSHLITPQLASQLREHVEQAKAAPATDEQKARLQVFLHIADHLDAYAALLDAERRLDYAEAANQAQRMLDNKMAVGEIDPFLYTYSEKREAHSEFTAGRRDGLKLLAARTNGEAGTLIAPLPLEVPFARDQFNQGIVGQWYQPDFDDSDWQKKDTYLLWEQQDEPETSAGHDYDGYGWYRATVEIPAEYDGRPIHFYAGGAINEAWVWVNGKYAGHKPHKLFWGRNQQIELDVTDLVKPGQKNVIAIRVLNDTDVGGLFRRGFFWSPNEGAE